MSWRNKQLIFLSISLFLVGLFFGGGKAFAEDQGVNVRVVVPASSGCVGNCNPPPTDNAPSISSASSTATNNSAIVSWSASDDHSISSASFVYGLNTSYGQTGTVNGTYGVNLSGLSSSTVYFYKITVVDSAAQSTNYTGSFQTLAGAAGDNVAPNISSISINSAQNTAVINFNTNENTTVQINYGLTTGFGSGASDGGSAKIAHAVTLLGLSPSTTYFFKIIATDSFLNSTSSIILNFKTSKDSVPPPDVSGLSIATGTSYLALSWTNPSLSFTPDFIGVKVLRKINSQAVTPNDSGATTVYNGGSISYSDTAVSANTTYYYTIFSYDESGNYSPGVFVSGKLAQVIPEICTNGIDDNSDGKIDCSDQGCANYQSCKVVKAEICNNNIDDDENTKIDCADTACINDQNCEVKVPTSTSKIGAAAACGDGIDNDSDGVIDFPSDAGCSSVSDSDEYSPPKDTLPGIQQLVLNKVRFFAGSHQIELLPDGNIISGLAGSNLSLHIRKSALVGVPTSFILRIGDSEKHQFVLNASGDTYFADSLFPLSGSKQAFVEINYGTTQFDSLGINLQSVALGQIQDGDGKKVSGADIVLYKENSEVFPASIFGQSNPIISNDSAQAGWMVPNGRFYLVVRKNGFYEYKSPDFSINNNIINQSVTLVKIPEKLIDVIDPNAPLGKNVANVVNNLTAKTKASAVRAVQKIGDAAKVVQEVAADPAVKEAATKVAPSAVGVAAVSTATIISWADILPLFRFLFLQPVLLLGRGKREKWGTVYNSLSKLPVDLAIIRLINLETGKIFQTKVTSSDGRYFFVVNTGKYRLEVKKGNFLFPSNLLKDFQVDGQKSDIYHGEEIVVNEAATVITANIPLDPAGQEIKTPRKLILIKAMRHIQAVVSWLGLIVTAVALYISPTWYMWVLLGVHLGMTFVFKRLSKAPAAKGWGIVYDDGNKKPLGNVVARLFDSKFNKLVATEITSADGKYYFVAGENQYYISYDRDGYQPQKTEVIDLKGKEVETVAEDIGLQKK